MVLGFSFGGGIENHFLVGLQNTRIDTTSYWGMGAFVLTFVGSLWRGRHGVFSQSPHQPSNWRVKGPGFQCERCSLFSEKGWPSGRRCCSIRREEGCMLEWPVARTRIATRPLPRTSRRTIWRMQYWRNTLERGLDIHRVHVKGGVLRALKNRQ